MEVILPPNTSSSLLIDDKSRYDGISLGCDRSGSVLYISSTRMIQTYQYLSNQ